MSGAAAIVDPAPVPPTGADPSSAAAPDQPLLTTPAAADPAPAADSKPVGEGDAPLLSGDKPAEVKADDKADPKPAVPETYQDFTLPEGMEIDKGSLEKALPVFKKLGLTQEGAQELVSLQAQLVKQTTEATHTANLESFKTQIQTWRNESRVDVEFGGDKLAENMGAAKAFVTRFDPKGETFALLDQFGLSDHPVMLRLLTRAAKTISEDKTISRGDGAAQQTARKPHEIMWPTIAGKE